MVKKKKLVSKRKVKPIKEDVSNKTVALVLGIVIIVSVLSLGMYVYYLGQVQSTQEMGNIKEGKVYLKVVEPPKESLPPVHAGAKVALKIVDTPSQ